MYEKNIKFLSFLTFQLTLLQYNHYLHILRYTHPLKVQSLLRVPFNPTLKNSISSTTWLEVKIVVLHVKQVVLHVKQVVLHVKQVVLYTLNKWCYTLNVAVTLSGLQNFGQFPNAFPLVISTGSQLSFRIF